MESRYNSGLFARVVDARTGEVLPMLLAAAQFFLLLFGYFMLRPLRETMGLRSGVDSVRLLFLGTVGVMILGNVVYGYFASRVRRSVLVPLVYLSVIASLGVFLALMLVIPEGDRAWVGNSFYIWLSVVNVFAVSVFWQLLADVFSLEQSKRLFGFIGLGGTAGAMAGSAYAWRLSELIGPVGLMGTASALFFGAGSIAWVLCRLSDRSLASGGEGEGRGSRPAALGGTAWSGFVRLLRSRYLSGIGLMVMLFTITSTLLYFEKLRIVDAAVEDDGARTAFFAGIELAGQSLTIVLQLFLTGRLMRWLGVGALLAVVPVISILGFTTLGFMPTLGVLTLFEATRRAGNFAMTKPARETLFTVMPREDKYKAKAGIDTFVYRGGDTVGTLVDQLISRLGLAIAAFAVPVGIAGVGLAWWLGREEERRGLPRDLKSDGDATGVMGNESERKKHAAITT